MSFEDVNQRKYGYITTSQWNHGYRQWYKNEFKSQWRKIFCYQKIC